MFKYYEGEQVRVRRYFVLDGVHYSVINRKGQEVAVPTSVLSENKSSITMTDSAMESTVSKINPDGSEQSSTVKLSSGNFKRAVSEAPAKADEDKEPVEIHIPEVKIAKKAEETPVKTKTNVIAINGRGKEFDLGEVEQLEDSAQVKKMSLDHEAILRCLNGKQKQHKGYRFKTTTVEKTNE